MVYIETGFYLKHHILDEILAYVFRQFMKGICQRNQLKQRNVLAFNAPLYVKIEHEICTYFQHLAVLRRYIKGREVGLEKTRRRNYFF